MARPVTNIPPLPFASGNQDVKGLASFDQDLSKALYLYLGEMARRVNNSMQMDGTEPMRGNLDMGAFSIINTLNITGTGTASFLNAAFTGTATIGTLHVTGNTDIDGTLNVDGASTVHALDATGSITATVNITATGNVSGAHVQRSGVNVDGWEVVYDQTFSAVTTLNITNLGSYRMLRINGYFKPDSVDDSFAFRFSSDNGSTYYSGATDYQNDMVYMSSTVAAVNPANSTGATALLSWGNAVHNSGSFGLRFTNLMIHEFNVASRETTWATMVTYYFGSTVHIGTTYGRPASVNTSAAMNAIRFYSGSANAFSGWLLLEGHR